MFFIPSAVVLVLAVVATARPASELLATQNIGVTFPPAILHSNSSFIRTTGGLIPTTRAPIASVSGNTSNTSNVTSDDSYSAASLCNAQSLSYSLAAQSWSSLAAPATGCSTFLSSIVASLKDTVAHVDWTTLCDGHARTPSDFTYPPTTSVSYTHLTLPTKRIV